MDVHCSRHPCSLARKTHGLYSEFGLDSHRYLLGADKGGYSGYGEGGRVARAWARGV